MIVDHDGARHHPAADLNSFFPVFRPYRAGQAEIGIIG
jgi:hypothetical protein